MSAWKKLIKVWFPLWFFRRFSMVSSIVFRRRRRSRRRRRRPPDIYIYIYIIRYRRCRNAQKKYIQFGTVGAETVNNIHNSIPQMPKRSKIHIIRHRRYRNYQTIIYFGTEGAETSPNIYIRHRRCRNARKYVYNSAPKVRRRSIIFIKYVPKVPKRQK